MAHREDPGRPDSGGSERREVARAITIALVTEGRAGDLAPPIPDWYPLMQQAERNHTPFWPAPSALDIPRCVLEWHSIAAQGEADAEKEMARRNRNAAKNAR